MNSEQARFILRAFRPGTDQPGDPHFHEAFQQLESDPALAAWFEIEMASDRLLRSKLRAAIPVPSNLRERLLALQRIVRPRPWWKHPRTLALAASIALLFTLGVVAVSSSRSRNRSFTAFRAAMVTEPVTPHISFSDRDFETIRARLQADQGPASDLVMPPGLASHPTKGCRVLEWHGRKVSLICYILAGGKHVDVFIIDGVDWPDAPFNQPPVLSSIEGVQTAAWTSQGHTYLITANLSVDELRRLFSV